MSAGNQDGAVGGLVPSGAGLPSPAPRKYVQDAEFPEANVELGQDSRHFQGVILDAGDPFEAALGDLIRVYRHRKPTLSIDGDIYGTYRHSAAALDIPQFGIPESLMHHLQQYQANINAMRRAGTLFDSDNQEALGSYFEMAFYAAMLYSWVKGYHR